MSSTTFPFPPWLRADGDKPVVEGRRRRRSGPQGSADRERAQAPQRRRDTPPTGGSSGSGGTPRPPVSGGGTPRPPISGGSGGGPQIPGGFGGILLIIILLVAGALGLPIGDMLGGGSGGSGNTGDQGLPPAVFQPTSPPVAQATLPPAAPPANAGDSKEWLIMIYADADDQVLERDIFVDINEAERIGSTDSIHIVAQVDRYVGGYSADGNWTNTRRYYITQDQDLERMGSPVVQDIGEANMADGQTLVDFVTWAAQTYPAQKHVLILSDHGMGWPGGWSDPTAPRFSDRNIPITGVLGDKLYLNELDDALGRAVAQSGIGQFELIGMDACLMAHLEVFEALQPHARYAVASQEVEPALGWAYTAFLSALNNNPTVSGDTLGAQIVDTYIDDDQRIVDDRARADFVAQGNPLGGLLSLFGGGSSGQTATVSASELAAQIGRDVTLTVVDLQALPQLTDAVNALAFAMQSDSQQTVAKARTYAQSFTNVFSQDTPSSYIDLKHFADLLARETFQPNVRSAAATVNAALDRAVIAEKSGPKKPGANGISVYFPTSQLYSNAATGMQSYVAVARRFADRSLWDDFLVFHYNGRAFNAVPASAQIPTRSEPTVIPGLADNLTISAVSASANTVNIGETVTLSADISGQNIGYVYLFVGFIDATGRSVNIVDSDYIEADETREVGGVFYPVWPAEPFTLRFAWEPIVYGISNGNELVQVHLRPKTYGESFENATYTVDGLYTFADGSGQRYAQLTFGNDGYLRTIYAYTPSADNSPVGAPWEVTPAVGDQFTALEEWLDLDASGQVAQQSRQTGGTLTFTGEPWFWQELDAAAGQYVVGFIVRDLDGQQQQSYTQVVVP